MRGRFDAVDWDFGGFLDLGWDGLLFGEGRVWEMGVRGRGVES